MKIGIGIDTSGTLAEVLPKIQRAEADGFAAVWIPNIFSYDAITLLALAGNVTSTIELGTFVVPTYPRHPAALAQQALTAAAATNGRFTLGIGLSHRIVIEDMFGLDYSKPIRHTREYLTILMRALTGEPTRFQGEQYRVAFQTAVPGATKPPVIVAALGPQMLKLAGSLADGTATWMGGPKYLEDTAVPIITKAAAEAGRPAPRIVSGFPVAVTNDPDGARAAASELFAIYGQLPSYRAVLDVEGAADAAGVAIVGNEDDVTRQLRHLAEAGVTDFNASPFPVRSDPGALARTMGHMAHIAKNGL
ncbi:MAG: TIGR03564 family F420-dependent LLM class oxidoreductase [Chloroflexi bacterium]|nr:TIGR03564 family F420-dependent LLM class oxidoreductase [Chloroflexota bacterium]